MGFVLFVLGFIIGFLVCITIKNTREINRLKSQKAKPLSTMNKKEFKDTMKNLEVK